MSPWRVLLTWLVPLSVLVANGGHSQPASADPPAAQPVGASAPKFQRIYMPSDQIQKGTWTQGYLPIDAEQFERLLQTADAAAIGAPGAQAAQIESGQYTAQLVGEDLLVGSATVRLVRRSDKNGILTLEPCSLAVGAATWHDQNAKPAVLGTGSDGRLAVLVEGADLRCDWSLRGERTASGSVSFHVELPGCPLTRLTLDTPAGLDVIVDQGIATKAAGATPKTTRWTFELGGRNRITLRVVSEAAGRERRPLTLLRQSLTYGFSARGINVDAQLKLDIHGEPLQRIAVDLDPSLRLVAARYGELQVPWSATTNVETRMSHVVLQLPEPIDGTGRVLQLSALAPLTTDSPWRLPGLQPQGMSWQEGTVTLLIPNPLVLEQLTLEGCRQSRTTALTAPASGESIEIQNYRPGAAVVVALTRPREQLKVGSGTSVEVGATEITSRSNVELTLAHGERREIPCDVNPGWIIDAVESLPSGKVMEWAIEDQPNQPAQLKMRLDTAVSASHPVRLSIRGHRPLPAGGAFESRQLEMLNFDAWQRGIRLISVRGADGFELRWTGLTDLNRLDPLKLSPAELQLFGPAPQGPLFADDALFAQSSVAVARRKPSFSAEIRIDAVVQKQVLTETYAIQCVPEAARIERLLVRFSQPRDAPLEWSLAGGTSGQFSARKISAGEQAQVGLPAGGEGWELNLRLSRSGPFELRAVRSTPLEQETPMALASVADAATQRGSLTLRALGDSGLTIKNRRLASVPAELLEADRYQTARATYHYQPTRDDLGAEPAVSIAPARPAQSESGAWVWSSRLDSRLASAGVASHRATLRIQTAGQQQLRVTLPHDTKLQAAWVDEQKLPLVLAASGEDGFVVDLPSGRSFATLSLYYSTPDGLPRVATSSQPPFPQVNIPVVARTWSVWLPPGYSVLDADYRFPIDSLTPISWVERFFGRLGRVAPSTTFNPLDSHDWRQLAAAGSEVELAHKAGLQLAHNLGAVMSDYLTGDSESELTWGQLLTLCGEAESQAGRTLLIDRESLAWMGLTPQTRVRFQPGDSPLERGIALLKQVNLVVISQPSVVGVTTASTAAAYARQLASPAHGTVVALRPGPLWQEFERAGQPDDWSNFESAAVWRAAPERGPSPWSSLELTGNHVAEPGAWNAYTLQLSPDGSPRIPIVHIAALDSLGWAVFLAVVAIGLSSPKRHAIWLAVFCLVAAGTALLLPAVYVPLASSALLGGLVCLALRIMRFPLPQAKTGEHPRSSRIRIARAPQVATLLMLAAALNAGAALLAAAPEPPAPTAAVYQVFVPVDEQQNQVGDKYYIPKDLFNQLLRQAAIASGQPKGCLVTRAVYQGTMSRDPVTKQLGLTQLKVSLDLRVFQSNVPILLPFPREGTANPISGARLEGRTIPVAWNAAGDAIQIGKLAAERYRLELDLQPALQAYVTTAGFDLAIPQLANATLELTLPPDAPAIELPTAQGKIHRQKERAELLAQLGACNHLTVRWPVGIGTETAAANLEVEELIWVRVRPGTTVLDARFKYRVLEGRVRQIRLLTDPRLRLLPSINAQSPITAHTIPGDPQKIDLELSKPVSDQVVIDLSFLLTGTSGVGNLQLPRLESSGARATKRWLAASVDPALQYKELPGEDSKPLAVADFMTSWGAAETRPQAAYSISRGEAMWMLATQPGEPHTTVEQLLAVSLGRGSARVQFDAALSIAGGYLFQLGMNGPPGLTIERVSVLEDDVERVARWTVDDQGRITVFLTAPITGRQSLKLRGRVDAARPDSAQVPQVEFTGGQIKRKKWRLYRQAAVLVDVEKNPKLATTDITDVPTPDGFGALVGCYESDDPQVRISATIAPNAAQFRATTVTTLERDADRWMAELTCQVKVVEGLIDALQFEIPPQWSEPFRIDPPAPFKIVPVPGETRRQLIVYPQRPIHDQLQLKIRGRVVSAAGDRLRVPDIVLQRTQQVDRFVVLPEHLDLQQVNWETVGLTRGALPAEFVAPSRSTQSTVVYQVAAERFQALLKGVQRTTGAAQISLADIRVVWQPDGNCQGVATFDLEPNGANHCVLELPAGCELLHVSVENLPAQVAPLGANRWRLSLGPPELPERVEVIYTGPLAGTPGRRRFEAPRLLDLNVAQTLWTIFGPPPFGPGRPDKSPQLVSAARPELERLKSAAALIQLPAEITGQHLPEEIARWYRSWKNRYAASRAALDRQLTVSGTSGTQTEEAIEAREMDKKVAAVEARLGSTSAPGQTSVADLSSEFLATAHVNLRPAFYLANGPLYDIELLFQPPASTAWIARWAAGLGLIALGIATAIVLRGRQLPQVAPWLVIASIGFAWWLLLTPSAVGFLIMLAAASLGLYGRRNVRSRLIPTRLSVN